MRIEAGAVKMSSERTYSSYNAQRTESILTTADKAATLEFSDESKTLMEQMKENQEKILADEKEKGRQNAQSLLELISDRNNKVKNPDAAREKSPEELKLEVLKRILKSLRGVSFNGLLKTEQRVKEFSSEYKMSLRDMINNKAYDAGAGTVNGLSGSQMAGGGTKWTKTVVTSSFFGEHEKTAFKADGIVRTADGREINFGVTVEMSRSFCQKHEELTQVSYIMTDPLVINLDTNIGSVTEQKFLFDIDADGKEESISFAGEGSGFLALDKNRDGRINDGSELFGTRSGNGFKDLAEYDGDGNGWIDEADDIFKDLKIWTKDADGNDRLISLKEAGVGAIYLGNAATEFSLNRIETNQTDAVIRNTGVYLKEDGGVGTIQHIDLAI